MTQLKAYGNKERWGLNKKNAVAMVYWLAKLAMNQKGNWFDVHVGDVVVETTHLMGMPRGLGLLSAIGELIKIEHVEGEGAVHTIRTIEGIEQRWLNAMFAVVSPACENKTTRKDDLAATRKEPK